MAFITYKNKLKILHTKTEIIEYKKQIPNNNKKNAQFIVNYIIGREKNFFFKKK